MKKTNGKKAVIKTDAVFYAQVREVFVQARQFVHKTANSAMVKAYWLVGKMIAANAQQSKTRNLPRNLTLPKSAASRSRRSGLVHEDKV